jgi:bacillopeptidase F
MKKHLIALLFIIPISFFTQAQPNLSPTLNTLVSQNKIPNSLKINIYFTHQINFDSLNTLFNNNHTPLAERQKLVISKAQTLAKLTQENFLNKYTTGIILHEKFWIINMIQISATKDVFLKLLNEPTIGYIEEFDHYYGKPIEIIKGEKNKSTNGIEPGLAAINAPALWKMGYTGKARKVFSIDTGVWKEHKAIKNQFLGNYVPMPQAWHGIDSPFPVDKDGSHGTHTVGTELGLDKSNNDTIGVAFNAYYMVSDPIVTNIADIKPLPDYINVFQFALNPDGDTSTTDDIPDVINNSWGIDTHDDTTICAPSYVSVMFDAIQAAGIANVFSAGNSGPADTTIGMPQYVVNGLVNTFTVGALDGNSSNFPIASFSSRGPTACPASGSLAIKPEVSAPGVNVRSCVDTNNYAIYSGTSMAGPHVTGAVLLLKEAFPNVSGEEILKALYFSAVDLGQPGEDNTYGMGMIDVLAAYNYLAQTYIPSSPNNNPYDIKISAISSPAYKFICANNITPEFTVENYGQVAVTSFTIEYQLDSSTVNTQNWSGNLLPGQQISITLPSITINQTGNHELRIKINLGNAFPENDWIDNQRMARFTLLPTAVIPFTENFEQGIDSSLWLVTNFDNKLTWDTAMTSGIQWSAVSAVMPFTDYNPKNGQTDELISPLFNLPNNDSLFLSFAYAYNKIHNAIADTLAIYAITNCGNKQLLWKKGGDSLTTTLPQPQLYFVPDSSADWDTAYINLSTFKGNQVFFDFEAINQSGNNLYLDNIKIYQGSEPQSINKLSSNNYKIYPNPATNILMIERNNSKKSTTATIQIFNNLGMLVYKKQTVINRKFSLNVSNFTPGVYFLKITSNQENINYKFLKQ